VLESQLFQRVHRERKECTWVPCFTRTVIPLLCFLFSILSVDIIINQLITRALN